MDKFIYIGLTLALTVYGQLILKARALVYAPTATGNKLDYLVAMYTDFWVLSGFGAAVLASGCWALAVEKTGLSVAYPFMALSFVLVPVAAVFLFGESFSVSKLLGLCMIVVGVALSVR